MMLVASTARSAFECVPLPTAPPRALPPCCLSASPSLRGRPALPVLSVAATCSLRLHPHSPCASTTLPDAHAALCVSRSLFRMSTLMATAASVDLSTGDGLREGRGGRRRGQAGSGRHLKVERGSQTPTRVETGMASRGGAGACEPAVLIDLTSSGDERSGEVAGRGQVTEQRGDRNAGGSNRLQQSLPNTPRPRRPVRVENPADLTPNFRSAAAMAGWDDETLLMLAVGQESPALLRLNQATEMGSPEGPSRAASCSDTCAGCRQCRERKRGTRTPGQAATPLSAARRHRRVRRISSNEEPLVPIPMAVFNDEGDKCGAPARKSEGCSKQHPFEDKENKNPQPSAKSTRLKEAAGGQAPKSGALQLDQLREELTCVVCLDICFEPSTTSCGHSFCRGCLQSVYQKCGMRCPKCRQQLRATSKKDCPINTVLWNTIQLLFPQETAARLKDQKKSSEKFAKPEGDTVSRADQQAESQLRPGVVRRISRPTPWRDLTTARGTERLRPNVGSLTFSRGSERLLLTAGNLTSFRRASEVLELGQSTLNYPTGRVDGYQQMRGRRPTGSSYRSTHVLTQEEEDAALAARLQESFIIEAGL